MRNQNHYVTLALVVFLVLTRGIPALSGDTQSAVAKVPQELCEEMVRHKTLIENKPVSCQRLALVKFSYLGFDGQAHNDGEIIVLDAAAAHVKNIFDTLLTRHFPLHKAQLLNRYEGDDDASMADNNTSAFNDRPVSGGSNLSVHAYGLAIDVNPVQNPFIQRAGATRDISPKEGERYLERKESRPGMIDDTIIDVFAENGFPIWGGDWHSPIDYQHFQVDRNLAEQLARASSADAKVIFDKKVEQYRQCRQSGKARRACTANLRS
jgi:hypothetical protein